MHSFSVLKQPAFRGMQCSATALLLIGLQAFTELLVFCTLIVSWGGICRKKSTGRLMLSPFHRLSCSQHLRYFSLKISQNACILHFVPLVNSCLKALLRPNKPILKHSGEKAQWKTGTVEKVQITTTAKYYIQLRAESPDGRKTEKERATPEIH